ncbi:MAG: hypothetical protein AMJ53_14720 [Gammaproteobacteria bacterium SG8_11]|nr:MAG: hypothetical protein AMJ53_14720 [Gammaproteobacteria bacterium SG8_11]
MNYLIILTLTVLLIACNSPYSSHTDKVKAALDQVDYKDGINKTEAKAIADAYLIHYGVYKGRPSYTRITEAEEQWLGEVLVVKSLATPVNAGLPPVIVDKKTGAVKWQHGPEVEKVSLDNIATGPKRTS